jgi:hypothetical protein
MPVCSPLDTDQASSTLYSHGDSLLADSLLSSVGLGANSNTRRYRDMLYGPARCCRARDMMMAEEKLLSEHR